MMVVEMWLEKEKEKGNHGSDAGREQLFISLFHSECRTMGKGKVNTNDEEKHSLPFLPTRIIHPLVWSGEESSLSNTTTLEHRSMKE